MGIKLLAISFAALISMTGASTADEINYCVSSPPNSIAQQQISYETLYMPNGSKALAVVLPATTHGEVILYCDIEVK